MQVDTIFLQQNHILKWNGASKRPRSPVSPSPSERPLKRTSTGPESNEPTPAYAHCSLPEESDVTMNDGEESSSNIETRGRSEDWVAKTGGLRLDSPSLSTYAQLLHTATPFPEEKIPSNSLPSYPIDTPSPNPGLFVSNTPFQRSVDDPMDIGSSLLASNEYDGSSSPTIPLTTSLPQSPRKTKIKMGRRADCDKCRLGVKGHWMHID